MARAAMSPRAPLLPDLPRAAWLLLGGESLSALGGGLTLPFVLVYPHDVRGLELGLAGLVMACLAAVGFVGSPLGGALSDRAGARATLVSGLLAAPAGALAFAFVREPWHAFGAAALLGLGLGLALPAQDALLARLVGDGPPVGGLLAPPRDAQRRPGRRQRGRRAARRRRGARQLRAAVHPRGGGRGRVRRDRAATAPFAAHRERGAAPRRDRRLRRVLADRRFRRLLPLVALLFAAGYGQYHAAFPAYAVGAGGLGASALGAAFAANTFTVVGAQLLVARALCGRRRSRGLALVGCTWATAWAIVLLAADLGGGVATVIGFCLAMVVFGLGETVLAPTLGSLVNELASEELRGRYNGASAFAATGGFVVGPAAAGALLGAGLGGALIAGLVVGCALVAVAALALDARLPQLADRGAAAAATLA